MVQGTGVDIVEIDRFRNQSDELKFIAEFLTETELRNAPHGGGRHRYYASLFATKEALLKALRCGLHDGSYWHDVEVSANGELRLSGRLASLASQLSVTAIHSSQSCSENRVVAFVLLENDRQEETHEQRRIVRDEIQRLHVETVRR
jgi:phosphopantetheine--protein transferase-like protein